MPSLAWWHDSSQPLAPGDPAAGQARAPAAGVTFFLYGSRARGDWDGFSDTDLLVVDKTREQAEQVADRLLNAGVGDDVLAISRDHWQRMVSSPSAEKRAIPAADLTRMGATSPDPLEETPPGDLFDRHDAERAIATAAAVLAATCLLYTSDAADE